MSKNIRTKPINAAKSPAQNELDFLSGFDEPAESRTVASRKRIHDKVDCDVSRYLATGGKINRIAAHVTADPPKRPSYRYGQRPI